MTAARPRGVVRPDVIYLGWRQLSESPDPGPPPAKPAPASPQPGEPEAAWRAAQRREYRRHTRPARLLLAFSLALAAGLTLTAWLGPAGLTGPGLTGGVGLGVAVVAAGCALTGARQVCRGRRVLARAVQAERERLRALAAAQAAWQAARRDQYARRYRAWQQRSIAFARGAQWFPVALPDSLHRLDVAGGTLAGWSAVLTMVAAPRLAAGGAVTVVDLTEGAVAADLIAVARQAGLRPQVLVLPADLPRLTLGAGLEAAVLADVLARTVAAIGGRDVSQAAPATDAAIIGLVLDAIGTSAGPVPVHQLLAGLRVVGQAVSPADQLDLADLTREQLGRLHQLAGRGATDFVIGRAWAIHAGLRALAPLATAPASRASPLSVAWLDRRAPAAVSDALAAYLPIALTATLRQAPPLRRWQHTVVILAAERASGDVLDRLCAAAEIAGTGLVLCYRSIPAHVRERLGRGNAAVGFMRLGNADDARAAAEQIGAEHRFVVSQLTDTIGASVTDTVGLSYTSSEGSADSVADSRAVTATIGRSRSRGRAGHGPLASLPGPVSADASRSAAISGTRSITAGITAGTSWGWSTSRAVGASDSLARTTQRSRESIVEPHELQQLPQSAVLLCYPAAGGREVVLADANPAIMTLPAATLGRPPLAR